MKKTYIAGICLAIGLMGLGLYYLFRDEPLPPPAPPPPPAQVPNPDHNLSFEGTGLTHLDGDKPVWELKAERITVDQNAQTVVFENIRGTFYATDTQGAVEVSGATATVNMKTRDVTISGKVLAKSDTGSELAANTLEWLGGERRFRGRGNVRYQRSDTIVTGDYVEANAHLDQVRIEGRARVRVRR